MNQLLGAGLILGLCPLMGAFGTPPAPSSRFARRPWRNRSRSRSHQFNWSQWRWSLEILQGLLAVSIAKLCFPDHPEWDIIALMGVAIGRFWRHRTGGILMMLAGYMLHNPFSGIVVLLFGMIGSMIFRENRQIAFVWLMLMPLITVLRSAGSGILIFLTAGLAGILYGMEQSRSSTPADATASLFRADSLDDVLDPNVAGELATGLAQLKQKGLPVPPGWLIYPGDDPDSLAPLLQPSVSSIWVVRGSFVDDRESQVYCELSGLSSIWRAIVQLFEAHVDESVAAIVQPQIECCYSGKVYCQAPTLKADIPSPIAEKVLALVDRLNQELNTFETLEWGYDGQQVWILQVQ